MNDRAKFDRLFEGVISVFDCLKRKQAIKVRSEKPSENPFIEMLDFVITYIEDNKKYEQAKELLSYYQTIVEAERYLKTKGMNTEFYKYAILRKDGLLLNEVLRYLKTLSEWYEKKRSASAQQEVEKEPQQEVGESSASASVREPQQSSATKKTFRDLIHPDTPDPDRLIKRLNELFVNKKGKDIANILLSARYSGYLIDLPSKTEFAEEFKNIIRTNPKEKGVKDGKCSWQSIAKYLNDNVRVFGEKDFLPIFQGDTYTEEQEKQ